MGRPVTKYAAQQIAEQIQGWLPARAMDPEFQYEITQLWNQLAELRQRMGDNKNDKSNQRLINSCPRLKIESHHREA